MAASAAGTVLSLKRLTGFPPVTRTPPLLTDVTVNNRERQRQRARSEEYGLGRWRGSRSGTSRCCPGWRRRRPTSSRRWPAPPRPQCCPGEGVLRATGVQAVIESAPPRRGRLPGRPRGRPPAPRPARAPAPHTDRGRRAVTTGRRFGGLRIVAAGAGSPVMTRLGEALAAELGLRHDPEGGDLVVRVVRDPARTGWEAQVRTTPRPLGARPWRVSRFPGSLNATIAAHMVGLARPRPGRALNLLCGAGTLAIEHLLADPAGSAVGVDLDGRRAPRRGRQRGRGRRRPAAVPGQGGRHPPAAAGGLGPGALRRPALRRQGPATTPPEALYVDCWPRPPGWRTAGPPRRRHRGHRPVRASGPDSGSWRWRSASGCSRAGTGPRSPSWCGPETALPDRRSDGRGRGRGGDASVRARPATETRAIRSRDRPGCGYRHPPMSTAARPAPTSGGVLDAVERRAWGIRVPTRRLFVALAAATAGVVVVASLAAAWVAAENRSTIADARREGLQVARAASTFSASLVAADADASGPSSPAASTSRARQGLRRPPAGRLAGPHRRRGRGHRRRRRGHRRPGRGPRGLHRPGRDGPRQLPPGLPGGRHLPVPGPPPGRERPGAPGRPGCAGRASDRSPRPPTTSSRPAASAAVLLLLAAVAMVVLASVTVAGRTRHVLHPGLVVAMLVAVVSLAVMTLGIARQTTTLKLGGVRRRRGLRPGQRHVLGPVPAAGHGDRGGGGAPTAARCTRASTSRWPSWATTRWGSSTATSTAWPTWA